MVEVEVVVLVMIGVGLTGQGTILNFMWHHSMSCAVGIAAIVTVVCHIITRVMIRPTDILPLFENKMRMCP